MYLVAVALLFSRSYVCVCSAAVCTHAMCSLWREEKVRIQHGIINVQIYSFHPVTYQESRYLWRCIKPSFTAIMNRVYLTEISCEENDLLLQLPFHAKYLLLSSYLASNNPSKTDRRFFSKVSYTGCMQQYSNCHPCS